MLATVILHYGKPELTGLIHKQLLHSDPESASHIFVLDNFSPQPYSDSWMRTDKNLHWAGALQFCLQKFSSLGYSHLWFLNNDIYFVSKPPFLVRTWQRHQYLSRKYSKIGIYSPAATQNPYHPQMVQQRGQQFCLVEYVDGIAPLIDITCWQELGGLDYGQNIYGYGVDICFCIQAKKAEWNIVVDHQVVIKHKYHATSNTINGYLKTAALAEHEFLSARLGIDYRQQIKAMSSKNRYLTK